MRPSSRLSSPPFLLLAAVLAVSTASSDARLSSPTSASLLPSHRFRRASAKTEVVPKAAAKKKTLAPAKKKLEAKGEDAGEHPHAFQVPAGYNHRERPDAHGPVSVSSNPSLV